MSAGAVTFFQGYYYLNSTPMYVVLYGIKPPLYPQVWCQNKWYITPSMVSMVMCNCHSFNESLPLHTFNGFNIKSSAQLLGTITVSFYQVFLDISYCIQINSVVLLKCKKNRLTLFDR